MLLLASKTYMLIAPPGFWKWNFAGLADWFVILDFWVIAERCALPPKGMINFSFFQAGWAHTCVSSVQNILFSQAGLFQGLCAVSVLTAPPGLSEQ